MTASELCGACARRAASTLTRCPSETRVVAYRWHAAGGTRSHWVRAARYVAHILSPVPTFLRTFATLSPLLISSRICSLTAAARAWQVWSCGCNTHGQLGHGANFGREPLWRLVEVQSLSDERVVQLACGGAHSAAVTAGGDMYTWGKNLNGQLGHGDVQAYAAPQKLLMLAQRVTWAACGGAHTACLVKVRDDDAEDADIEGSTARTTARSARSSAGGTSRNTDRNTVRSTGGGTGRSPSHSPTKRKV